MKNIDSSSSLNLIQILANPRCHCYQYQLQSHLSNIDVTLNFTLILISPHCSYSSSCFNKIVLEFELLLTMQDDFIVSSTDKARITALKLEDTLLETTRHGGRVTGRGVESTVSDFRSIWEDIVRRDLH